MRKHIWVVFIWTLDMIAPLGVPMEGWIVLSVISGVLSLYLYRKEIAAFFGRAPAPDPTEKEIPDKSIPSNGKETAKMILRSSHPQEAQKIYDKFNLLPHKYDEIYVHQAFVRHLEKAGEIEQADAVYESSPHLKGSTRKDAIRFALLVHEVENEA